MEDEENKEKRQCVSCGRWVEEDEIIGEVCVDCHATFMEDADAG